MTELAFVIHCGNCGFELTGFEADLMVLIRDYAEHVRKSHPSNNLHLPETRILR